VRLWAVLPALLTLGACAERAEVPVQTAMDCSRGFEALKAQITAEAGAAGAPGADEPFPTYFVDRGRAYYSISKVGVPGHPMILHVTQTSDGEQTASGCGYGDQAAYQRALHEFAALGKID